MRPRLPELPRPLSALLAAIGVLIVAGAAFESASATVCVGDCTGDNQVSIDELVRGVSMGLGRLPVANCDIMDAGGDERVTVDELVLAVHYALNGCPTLTPTVTPTGTMGVVPTLTPQPTPNTPQPSPTTPAPPPTTAPPTPTTPAPTASPGGPGVAEAVAGGAVAVMNGMNVIPSIIAAIASGFQYGAASGGIDDGDSGGAAATCPGGSGTATRTGSFPNVTITLSNCVLPIADGVLVVDGVVTVTGVFLPPYDVTINVTATFKGSPAGPMRLTASATNLMGKINPYLSGGSCYVSGAGLQLTEGTLSTQIPGDGSAMVTFANTAVGVAVDQFNPSCVPVIYSLTFTGPATIATTTGAAAAAAMQSFSVQFDSFVVHQDATASATQTQMNGSLSSACFGGRVTLETRTSLAQAVGAACPNAGKIRVTAAADGVVQIFYLPTTQVGIDSNADDAIEQTYSSCLDSALECVVPVTPTSSPSPTRSTNPTTPPSPTISPTATPTRTEAPPASATSTATWTTSAMTPPSSTATPSATSTVSAITPPSLTATPSATWTASATTPPSSTPTPTPTPSPTPSLTPATRVYCDRLLGTLPIPDAICPGGYCEGVADTFEIADDLPIRDVNVWVQIDHSWVGDLVVFVHHVYWEHYVTLIDRPGLPARGPYGCGNDDVECTLDDEAAQFADDQCAASSPTIYGTFRPTESLSFFDGESSAGAWALSVYDLDPGGTGSLVHWCVEIR